MKNEQNLESIEAVDDYWHALESLRSFHSFVGPSRLGEKSSEKLQVNMKISINVYCLISTDLS